MSENNISRSSIFRSKMKKAKEDEELRKLAKEAQIHPMMSTKYNAIERKKLREFEQELLKNIELDI